MKNLEQNQNLNNQNQNEIKLSSEQEKNFLDFLKQKEKNEQRKLTSEEINNLKKEFLESQEIGGEYIEKSSDLLSGSKLEENFGNKENFEKFTKTIDSGVYSYFFGGNGILKKVNISEAEKKSFSASASVFLMDSIYKEVEKSGNLPEIQKELFKILGNSGEKGSLMDLGNKLSNFDSEKISDLISTIKDLLTGDIVKVFAKVYDAEKMNIISETLSEAKLTNNQIFTNPKETYNFFENIFKNNLDKESVKKLIREKNSEKIIFGKKGDLKEVGDKMGKLMTPKIGNALSKVSDIKDFFQGKIDSIAENISGNKELVGTLAVLTNLPIIGEFLKMILDFFNIDLEELEAGFKQKSEKIKSKLSSEKSFLEGIKFNEKFTKNSDGKYDSDFFKNIEKISGNKSEEKYEEDLEKLFEKGGNFENFIKDENLKKIPNFGEKNILKNEKGEIIYENFKFLTSLYKEFLESKENSLENFINKKVEENKNIDDEIYGGGTQTTNNNTINNSEPQNKNTSENNSTNNTNIQNSQEQNNTTNQTISGTVGANTSPSVNNTENKNIPTAPFVASTIGNLTAQKEQINNKNTQIQEPIKTNQNVETKTDKPKTNENFLINKNEGIEIKDNKINLVFDNSGKKYEATVFNNGALTIVGEGKKAIFKGEQKLHTFLIGFNGKLNTNVTGEDFGYGAIGRLKSLGLGKDVLINGAEGNPGLKGLLLTNFFSNGNIKKENISINLGKDNYNFVFEKEIT